jgi:diguanylate cyclase (GGDEF)-like protein
VNRAEPQTGLVQEEAPETPEVSQLACALEASGLAAYAWTVASDALVWSANAAAVLEATADSMHTGRHYAGLIDLSSGTSRYDAVMAAGGTDTGQGVAFQVEYLFRPGGRGDPQSLWVEDTGRWFAGPDGSPARILGTVRRVDERRRRQQDLNFLSLCDPLTGMMNRLGMIKALREAITGAAGKSSSCALLVAEIGNLAVVNEAYGFQVADEVMAEAGRRLARVTRAGDVIARCSGSKFGLILHHCNEEDIGAAAERFLASLRESVLDTEAGPVWALLSIGAVVLPRHGTEPDMAITLAEEALAQARRQPFDGFAIYEPSEQRLSERVSNARYASVVVRCLKEQRLHLAFQPVIDASTRRTVFHEALLRLTDHEGQPLPAGQLVAVAERLGLVRLIDRAVVELAVEALRSHPGVRISINISGTTATDPRWFPEITAILAASSDVADRLLVEITETVALGDLADTSRFVQQLRNLGVTVAIDDFGAGYTSFRNLRAIPVDMLKIDGSFCHDLEADADNRHFVQALIQLARAFGLRTVAEWVETDADADMLQSWGIDMMQGKLFGEADTLPEQQADDDLPPTEQILARYSEDLEIELLRLRRAVALLDEAFHTPRRSTG